MKLLVHANKEDFVQWGLSFLNPALRQIPVSLITPLETEFKRSIIADILLKVELWKRLVILHFEFQASNDDDVPDRVLEYHMQARRKYKLPVCSFIIYLQDDGKVPQSPLVWNFPEEEENMLQFRYKVIDLPRISAEELRQTGLSGLRPLMILTRDGATREVAEEIMTDLGTGGKNESLLTAYMLISLVFSKNNADDLEWFRKRWKVMSDRLKDSWIYQEILEQGREEERKAREEERRQELERWRQTLLGVVHTRFASQKIERLAQGQATVINSPKILQDLILKMIAARTPEEAQDYLLSWSEDEQESA